MERKIRTERFSSAIDRTASNFLNTNEKVQTIKKTH